ncbi:hypothetical protein BV22DRAFT_1084565 [Leucogyrophana mollusca]|uniref:Uncharacterized protein n=1 Tax=Leucogyrophana mollusca TaxID=85980 RepID=A0ACB8BPB3_9AGAM|nr:hypothetical protein BV22DRAFT_1084565 [Leucogyrophana mollusca]
MIPTSRSAMDSFTQHKPTAGAPLARTSSFLGTIKSLVTAPLQWFASTDDDFEDTKGKRRRLPASSAQLREDDAGEQARNKRMRVNSPDRDPQPYLDPPGSAFRQQQQRRTSGHTSKAQRQSISSPRKNLRVSVGPPSGHQSSHARHTLSPHPSGSHLRPQSVSRTMSLDPPSSLNFSAPHNRIQPAPTMRDLTTESSVARDSMSVSRDLSRDVSMSPGRHLHMRTSLTPQPSSAGFGPVVPPRRERDSNEPPPLTALMSNPMFVRPPPGLGKQGSPDLTRQTTLGSLMDSQRSSRSPIRQSSVLFGNGSMSDVSAPNIWPVNAAEKALHELEVYKTPLLPTRLKGSTAIPDIFMPKKSHQITLMRDERDSKPRLGMKGKGKDKGKRKEGVNGTKPYAGEGGMKKWLARRKREEEQAREREKDEAMRDDDMEEEKPKPEGLKAAGNPERSQEPEAPPVPPIEPVLQSNASRETSSLRVGRTRTSRNHIERTVSRRMNKFSAVFDEDEDDQMDDERAAERKALEEAAKKAPVFEIPAGFSFAKEMPISHDVANAKEPPISTLPFSFTKPAASTAAPTAPVPPAQVPQSASKLAFSLPTPAPQVPSISLVPPTPQPPKPEAASPLPLPALDVVPPAAPAPPASTSSGVPNFFANSAALSKPLAIVTPPTSAFSVVPLKDTENPLWEGEKDKATDSEASKVTVAGPSLVSAPTRPSSAPSLFDARSSPSAPAPRSLFDTVAAPGANTSLFGTPAVPGSTQVKETAPSAPPPFSFGTPAKPVEGIPAPSVPADTSKPSESTSVTSAVPSLFGNTSSSSAFSFGAPAPSGTEPPKSAFSFGQPAPPVPPAPSPLAPVIEAPKPLFGGTSPAPFSFGRPNTAPGGDEKPAANSFSFGSAPATPPAPEKKPPGFSFGAPTAPVPAAEKKTSGAFPFGIPAAPSNPAPPPSFSFGGSSGSSNAADVSKPFSFGQVAPARPATPPKAELEVNMDESPTRDMNMNGNANGKAPERPTLNFSFGPPSNTSGSSLFAQSPSVTTPGGFSFGTPAPNPFASKPEDKAESKPAPSFGGFGQSLTTSGFAFGQKAPESPAAPSPATGPFSFGQPSPNAAPSSPFSFGAPAASNPFGQSTPSPASAPTSPSAFNRTQPAPSFSFGTPTAAPAPANNSPFAFGAGSQPASPASGNTSLPQPPGSSGGGFSFGQSSGTGSATAANSNPFGAAPPSSGGGALFTIGAAPPPPDSRQIKKLPRRGGRR